MADMLSEVKIKELRSYAKSPGSAKVIAWKELWDLCDMALAIARREEVICDSDGGVDGPAFACQSVKEHCHDDKVVMEIGGRPVGIDACIAGIVSSLNAGGIATVASCCGHGHIPGMVMLEDGRWLAILPDQQTWERFFRHLPTIHGEPRGRNDL